MDLLHSPRCNAAFVGISWRARLSNAASVISATASTGPSGVEDTATPKSPAASKSTLATPIPTRASAFSRARVPSDNAGRRTCVLVLANAVEGEATKFKAPLLPISCKRLGPARYRVTFHEPLMPDADPDEEKAIYNTVLLINRFTEAVIREAPDQWFWMHNRWPKDAWAKAGVMER